MNRDTFDEQDVDGHRCTFEPASHTYTIAGHVVPSVTQVLNDVGLIDFSQVPRAQLFHAQERGTRVHRAIHYWLENDLDTSQPFLPDDEMGYFESAMSHLEQAKPETLHDAGGRPIGVEWRFWDLVYRCGGTIDYVALDPDGVIAVRDFKTGMPVDVAASLQTAKYEEGLRESILKRHPHLRKYLRKGIRRMAVKLFKDGRPGRVEPYHDPRDLMQFNAALSCVWFKRRGFRHAA